MVLWASRLWPVLVAVAVAAGLLPLAPSRIPSSLVAVVAWVCWASMATAVLLAQLTTAAARLALLALMGPCQLVATWVVALVVPSAALWFPSRAAMVGTLPCLLCLSYHNHRRRMGSCPFLLQLPTLVLLQLNDAQLHRLVQPQMRRSALWCTAMR